MKRIITFCIGTTAALALVASSSNEPQAEPAHTATVTATPEPAPTVALRPLAVGVPLMAAYFDWVRHDMDTPGYVPKFCAGNAASAALALESWSYASVGPATSRGSRLGRR